MPGSGKRPKQSSQARPSRRNAPPGQKGRKLWSVWTTPAPLAWAVRKIAGTEERKRVVDVDDVGSGPLDRALEEVLPLARPHDAERKLRLLPERPILDLVAQQLELVDVAAVLAEQLRPRRRRPRSHRSAEPSGTGRGRRGRACRFRPRPRARLRSIAARVRACRRDVRCASVPCSPRGSETSARTSSAGHQRDRHRTAVAISVTGCTRVRGESTEDAEYGGPGEPSVAGEAGHAGRMSRSRLSQGVPPVSCRPPWGR